MVIITLYGKKIRDKKPSREIACGVHIGEVVRVKHIINYEDSPKYASYDINVAKRVEGVSRKGISSNIYVTNFIGERFNKWRKIELQGKEIKELRLLTCTGFKSAAPEPLKGIAEKVWVSELLPIFDEINLWKILEAIKEKKDCFKAYEMLSKCINIFFNQFNQVSHNRWRFGDSPLRDESEIDKYLENLIYLSKCSANLWFNFNALYIASALVTYAEGEKIQIADISQDIREIYDDLEENIKSIKKEG